MTDRACIVLCEEKAESLTLAISDPTHEAGTYRVTVSGPLVAISAPVGGSSVVKDGKTVVTCHTQHGRNYVARFAR